MVGRDRLVDLGLNVGEGGTLSAGVTGGGELDSLVWLVFLAGNGGRAGFSNTGGLSPFEDLAGLSTLAGFSGVLFSTVLEGVLPLTLLLTLTFAGDGIGVFLFRDEFGDRVGDMAGTGGAGFFLTDRLGREDDFIL